MRYTALHFMLNVDRFHLQVGVEGFPDWVVEVVLMQASAGAAISDLLVYPRQSSIAARAPAEDGLPDPDQPAFGPSLAEWIGKEMPAAGPAQRETRALPWSGTSKDIPAGGVPGRLMRAINTGQLLALASRHARQFAVEVGDAHVQHYSEKAEPHMVKHWRKISDLARANGEPAKRSGRRGNGIEHYLLWAQRYALKTEQGVAHPIRELADENGEGRNYVRDTVTDARRRYGLLTTAGQGRAGGILTPKALDLIRKSQEGQS